jgi:hypothetical protein
MVAPARHLTLTNAQQAKLSSLTTENYFPAISRAQRFVLASDFGRERDEKLL